MCIAAGVHQHNVQQSGRREEQKLNPCECVLCCVVGHCQCVVVLLLEAPWAMELVHPHDNVKRVCVCVWFDRANDREGVRVPAVEN